MFDVFDFAEFADPLAGWQLAGYVIGDAIVVNVNRQFLRAAAFTKLETVNFEYLDPGLNRVFTRNARRPVIPSNAHTVWIPKLIRVANCKRNAVIRRVNFAGDLPILFGQLRKILLNFFFRHLGQIPLLFSPLNPGFNRFAESDVWLSRVFSTDCVQSPQPMIWTLLQFRQNQGNRRLTKANDFLVSRVQCHFRQ